jgi:hypothetical protein
VPLKQQLKDFPGVIGPTGTGLAPAFDSEIAMNLTTERANTNAKAPIYFKNVPGFYKNALNLVNLGSGLNQSSIYINGRTFAIASNQFWEITGSSITGLSSISWGNLPTLTAPYWSIAVNIRGAQILMAGGGQSFLFILATNTLVPVVTPFPLSIVDESDGYFIGLDATGSGEFCISNYNDGTVWNALNFAFEQSPDLTTAFKVAHRVLWLFGDNHTEPYVDSGNANFPFTPDQTTYINSGIIAPYSLVVCDNTLFYLGNSSGGPNTLYRLTGATPQRISTHAFETAVTGYPKTSDAYAYRYSENGHEFYVIHFPSGNATWVYDCSTGMLTQRGVYNSVTGEYDISWDRFHVWVPLLNAHLVQDYRNANIYARSENYFDGGDLGRWMRRFPHFNSDQVSWDYHKLRLIMQTGVNGQLPPDYQPSVQLRRSFDGGYTWQPNIIDGSSGQTGQYIRHVDFDDLGNAKDMVFEWSSADATPVVLIGAKLSATPCFS